MNANDIARAIVSGAKETGANPIDLALGNDLSRGYPVDKKLMVSRARAYAGRALERVFSNIARPVIAKLIGVNKPSWTSFFSGLDGRTLPWWDEAAFGRVLLAVEAGRLQPEPSSAPAAIPEPPVISTGQRFRGLAPDKRFSEPYVPVGRPVPSTKYDDMLRRAVENTQKLTPPPEE